MIKFLTVILLGLFLSLPVFAASNIISNAYATTNVTTSAYVTVANAPITSGTVIVCDNSGQIVKVAFGSVGNEVDQFTAPLNGCLQVPLTVNINSGTRVSLKAISASATSGYNTVSFLP